MYNPFFGATGTIQYYSSGGYGGVASTGSNPFDGWLSQDPVYEMKLSIRQALSYGGTYSVYVNPHYGSGILDAWSYIVSLGGGFSGNGLSITDGSSNSILSTTVSIHDNMTFRVVWYNVRLMVYIDNTLVADVTTPGRSPYAFMAFQVYAGSGNLLTHVDLGGADGVPPSAISSGSIGVSAFYNHVDLSWPAATDSGSGVAYYKIERNGALVGTTTGLTFSDTAVVPNSTYTYTLSPVDFFGNATGTNFTVSTLRVPTTGQFPSATPEGRRVGVRTTGAYWGAGGENIDVMSGNLNFTVPLIKPIARAGMSVPFKLTYNSQNWRQDSGGQWKYGSDVGYGFGWRLLAGSITPVFSNPYTISYYLFTDSSGAEYRLDQNSSNIWTSKESVYVSFDANLNRLFFNSGTFWDFGCVSAATEADSGVMYPTLMEDPNGNQILIRYKSAPGALWANSSARIKEIEDVRAVNYGGSPAVYKTYLFTYNTDTIPHLTAIDTATSLTIGEAYTFTYLSGQSLASPFNSQSFGTTTLLQKATSTATSQYTQFTYNGSAELTNVRLPYGGYFAYDYTSMAYSSGRSFREVVNRYLSKDGSTQTQYPFSHEASPGPDVHQYTVLDDPGGVGEKYWSFNTSGGSMGLVAQYQGRHKPGPVAKMQNDFTWTQDAANNSYISSSLTTGDPGQTYAVQSKTEQTVDIYGNTTQTKNYGFASLVTPVRTYNYTYLGTSSYSNKYIRNRLTQGTLTDASGTTTLATVSYDQYTPSTISGSPLQWDTAFTPSVTVRGNATTTAALAGTTTTQYDVTGGVTSTTTNGITASATTSSSVNFAAPTSLTVGSFSDTLNYDAALRMTGATTPTSTLSIGYDSAGRNSSSSTYGATTGTNYNPLGSPPTVTSITNGVTTTTTLDGLGRPIKSANSDGVTDTEYDSCGCSPLGKPKRTTLPHAPGGTQLWTTNTYDGIGRTVSVLSPDGASTTTYLYQGNTVTITDPAGKWKKFAMDAFGQIAQVNEPNPAGGSDYVTTYTYDSFGHLSGVSMPRAGGTQTRTFAYSPSGLLGVATNPENGTVHYYYDGNHRLSERDDAKGQRVVYSYDSYGRIGYVQRYPAPTGPEDACLRETYSYDTNPYDATFTQNGNGRLTAVQYRGGGSGFYGPTWEPTSGCATLFTEMYSYNSGGAVVKKRLRVTRYVQITSTTYSTLSVDLEQGNTYDNNLPGAIQGKLTAMQYPPVSKTSAGGTGAAGPNLGYGYDSMNRVQTMTDLATSTAIVSNTTFNVAGEMLSMTGQYAETRTYNSLFQITGIIAPGVSMTYAYSATQNNGKIASQTDALSGETVQYTYDSLNRLATAQATNSSWGQSYTYDGFGNLTDQNVIAGTAPTLHVTYAASTNRQTGECSDANGNIGSGCTYTYDIENRMIAGGTGQFSYAPGNKRLWRGGTGVDEAVFYSTTGQKLATYMLSISGTTTMTATQTGTWYYFGGKLIKNAGGYVGQDRIGSVGNKFFPYGQERSATGNGIEKFGTYFRDSETGLDYAQNRFHQPGMGRFLTADSAPSARVTDPGSWNRYGYTGGDPVNRNDPNGRDWCDASWGFIYADCGDPSMNEYYATLFAMYGPPPPPAPPPPGPIDIAVGILAPLQQAGLTNDWSYSITNGDVAFSVTVPYDTFVFGIAPTLAGAGGAAGALTWTVIFTPAGAAVVLQGVSLGGLVLFDQYIQAHKLDIKQVRDAARQVARMKGCRDPEPDDYERVHDILEHEKSADGKVPYRTIVEAWKEVLCGK